MEKLTKQDGMSLNVIDENLKALKHIFPEAFTEDGIDFEILRQLLGNEVAEGEEKYGLNWFGKKKARQIALTPSTGTLRPCIEESVDWNSTKNIFIEGDNLEALKLLQKSYAGKIKLIYIDPPYNTGKEFIYNDNQKDNIDTYLKYTDQITEEGFKTSSNTETSGRFHTNWLNMITPRLKLARTLLASNGFIFISIDDHEQANLSKVCDEIFGEENFRGKVSRVTGTPSGQGYDILVNEVDYILVYAKSELASLKGLPLTEEDMKIYDLEDDYGKYLTRPLRKTGGEDRREDRPTMYYPIPDPDGNNVFPIGPGGYESRWRCGPNTYKSLLAENRITWKKVQEDGTEIWKPYQKFYLEGRLKQPSNLWANIEGNKKASIDVKKLLGGKVFDFPKPVELVERCIEISTEDDSIVLDFFAGSATTAHSTMRINAKNKTNRRYILVQLPEPTAETTAAYRAGYKNIADLGKQRIRKSAEMIKELYPDFTGDIGFKAFKLDSSNIIAWNPDKADLEQSLLGHMEHLVPGRTEQDVLYELLLKRGIELTAPIEKKEVAGKTVYSIGYGALFACLDVKIQRDQIEKLAQGIINWHKKLDPVSETQVVFRDSAFENDVVKTNITAILEQDGIKHVRSL